MEANATATSNAWHGRVAADVMMSLRDPALIAAYAMLAAFAGPDGTARVTAGIVGPRCGRDRTWAVRQLGRLAEIGLIEKIQRGACVIYRLLDCVRRSTMAKRSSPAAAAPATKQQDIPAEDLRETCEPVHTRCEPAHTVQTQIHQESGGHSQRARASESETESVVWEKMEKHPVPADWMPSEAVLIEAMSNFPGADISWHIQRFVRRCAAGGYRYADAGKAWLDWFLADEPKRAARVARENRGGPNQSSPGESRLSAWNAAAAQRIGARMAARKGATS